MVKQEEKAKSKKILLVEDSPTQAAATRLRLEAKGFTVQVAFNGASALAMVGVYQPGLIVLDFGLPDSAGPSRAAPLALDERLESSLNNVTVPSPTITAKQKNKTICS